MFKIDIKIKYYSKKKAPKVLSIVRLHRQTIEQIKFLDNNDEAYLNMIHEQPLKIIGNTKEDMMVFLENIFKSSAKLVSSNALAVWRQMTFPEYSQKELFSKIVKKIQFHLKK